MAKFKANPTFMGILTGLTLALAMPTGWASAMYTFTTSGTAADGRPDQATAVFDFTDANTLTITLTNTLNSNDWGISSVLDGLDFSMSATASSATLTNVTAAGVLDCTDGVACIDVTATSGETSPYNWLLGAGTDWLRLLMSCSLLEPYRIGRKVVVVVPAAAPAARVVRAAPAARVVRPMYPSPVPCHCSGLVWSLRCFIGAGAP